MRLEYFVTPTSKHDAVIFLRHRVAKRVKMGYTITCNKILTFIVWREVIYDVKEIFG